MLSVKCSDMISQEELKSIFTYSEGVLLWNEKSTGKMAKRFNKKYANKEAGYLRKYSNGSIYRCVIVNKKAYLVHRLIYLIFHGTIPDETIDHIDGNTLNNKIDNLRCVSQRENCRNRKRSSKNKSGVSGVHFSKRCNKWIARANNSSGKRIHIGVFDTKQKAIEARLKSEREFGYHENNGR